MVNVSLDYFILLWPLKPDFMNSLFFMVLILFAALFIYFVLFFFYNFYKFYYVHECVFLLCFFFFFPLIVCVHVPSFYFMSRIEFNVLPHLKSAHCLRVHVYVSNVRTLVRQFSTWDKMKANPNSKTSEANSCCIWMWNGAAADVVAGGKRVPKTKYLRQNCIF